MRILLIEDDQELCHVLKISLEKAGYQTDICLTGTDALYYALQPVYNLIILDRMLPGMDGLSLLKLIRSNEITTPVILATAIDAVPERIAGLDCGADDYIVKPFLPQELLYRISAILRRSYKEETALLSLADCQIDFERAEVLRGEKKLPLTAKEFALLSALAQNAGKIVTIDALCEAAWGDNPYGYENSLMAHIRRIREKIEENPSKPRSLLTVKGLGYKLITEE